MVGPASGDVIASGAHSIGIRIAGRDRSWGSSGKESMARGLHVERALLDPRGVHKLCREARSAPGAFGVGAGVASALPCLEAACARVVRLPRCLPAVRACPVAGARRSLEGTRAARSAPRAVDPAAAGAAAAANRERPARIGGTEPSGLSAFVAGVLRQARDAAALAPKDRRAPLDVPAPTAGSATDRPSGARIDPALGAREQPLGLCADRRRVAQARVTVSATLVRNMLARAGMRPK